MKMSIFCRLNVLLALLPMAILACGDDAQSPSPIADSAIADSSNHPSSSSDSGGESAADQDATLLGPDVTSSPLDAGDSHVDAGAAESSATATPDATVGAGSSDAGSTGAEAGADVSVDAPGDVTVDANVDVAADASADVTVDAGVDGATSTCAAYCTAVMGACTGANAQYPAFGSCMRACQLMAVGVAGQPGDTIACRTLHAGYAATQPNPHCWHAGPLGYGPCGAPYPSFCNIVSGNPQGSPAGLCTPAGGFYGGPPFNSYGDCLLHAAGFVMVDTPTSTIQPPGMVGLDGGFSAGGPAGGDTLDCRAYHLVRALQGGPTQTAECANVGPVSPTCQ